MLLRHRQPVLFKREHVTFNRLPNVADSALASLALRDAAWKTRTFSHPKSVFPGVDDYLSHGWKISGMAGSSTPVMVAARIIPEDLLADETEPQMRNAAS